MRSAESGRQGSLPGPKLALHEDAALHPGSTASDDRVLTRSRQQIEASDRASHDREMAAIDRRQLSYVEAFGGGDHGSVDRAEREVAVDRHQFGDPQPVTGGDRLGDEVAGRQVTDEPDFGIDADSRREQVHDLSDHELGDQKWSGMRFEEREAFDMVGIIDVDVGVERAGVDD